MQVPTNPLKTSAPPHLFSLRALTPQEQAKDRVCRSAQAALASVASAQNLEQKDDGKSNLATMTAPEILKYSHLNQADEANLMGLKDALDLYPGGYSAKTAMRMARNVLGGGLVTGGKKVYSDGFFPYSNFAIAKQILKQMSTKGISVKSQETIADLQKGITQLIKSAEGLEKIQKAQGDLYLDELVNEAKKQAEAVDRLKKGEGILFEGGWSVKGSSGGHTQIYEIMNTGKDPLTDESTFDVILYTSTGYPLIERYRSGNRKTRLVPQVKYKDVPAKALLLKDSQGNISRSFFQSLMELSVLSDRIAKPISNLNVEVIFDQLPNRVPVEILDVGLITGQRAGTCVPSVLKVWMRKVCRTPELYKQVIFQYKYEVLLSTYSLLKETIKEDSDDGRAARVLLAECAKNQARRVIKMLKGGLIDGDTAKVTHATSADLLARIADIEKNLVASNQKELKGIDTSLSHVECAKQRRERGEIKGFTTPIQSAALLPTVNLPSLIISKDSITTPTLFFQSITESLTDVARIFREGGDHASESITEIIHRLVDRLSIPKPIPGTSSKKFKVNMFTSPLFEQFNEAQLRLAQTELLKVFKAYQARNWVLNGNGGGEIRWIQGFDTLTRGYATLFPLYALTHFVTIKIDSIQHDAKRLPQNLRLENQGLPTFLDELAKEELLFLDAKDFDRIKESRLYLQKFSKNQLGPLFVEEVDCDVELGHFKGGKRPGNAEFWKGLLSADRALNSDIMKRAEVKYPTLTENQRAEFHRKSQDECRTQGRDPKEASQWFNLPEDSQKVMIMEGFNDEWVDYAGYALYGKIYLQNLPGTRIPQEFSKQAIMNKHGYGFIDTLREIIWRMRDGGCNWMTPPANLSVVVTKRMTANTGKTLSTVSSRGPNDNTEISSALLDQYPMNQNVTESLTIIPQILRDSSRWSQDTAEFLLLKGKGDPVVTQIPEQIRLLLTRILRPISEWKMAPAQILSELSAEINKLENPDLRAIVFKLFFRSPILKDQEGDQLELGVGDLITTDDALLDRVQKFMLEGLESQWDQPKAIDKVSFLFEISYYLCRFLHDKGEHEKGDRLNLLKEIEEKWLEKKDFSLLDSGLLHMYRVLFCSLQQENLFEKAPKMLSSWFQYRLDVDSTRRSPASETSKKVIEDLTEQLRLLQSNNPIFKKLLTMFLTRSNLWESRIPV